MYGFKTTQFFVIKCMMKKYPIRFVSVAFFVGVFGFGYALRVAEAPLNISDKYMDHREFLNCCWEVVITMLTGRRLLIPSMILSRLR